MNQDIPGSTINYGKFERRNKDYNPMDYSDVVFAGDKNKRYNKI